MPLGRSGPGSGHNFGSSVVAMAIEAAPALDRLLVLPPPHRRQSRNAEHETIADLAPNDTPVLVAVKPVGHSRQAGEQQPGSSLSIVLKQGQDALVIAEMDVGIFGKGAFGDQALIGGNQQSAQNNHRDGDGVPLPKNAPSALR
jgi:hypothetical protein